MWKSYIQIILIFLLETCRQFLHSINFPVKIIGSEFWTEGWKKRHNLSLETLPHLLFVFKAWK